MQAQTWLITGCSSGLGRALAEAALERDHKVIVTARNAQMVADIVAGHPTTALAISLDVTDGDQISRALELGQERFGHVDVLVNNAGYGYRSAVEEGDEAEVAELFATNFFGPVALMKAVLAGMRARGHGAIVNISSIAAPDTPPGSGYYAATKLALEGVSEGLRKEVEPLGIRVVVVEPGAFRTDFAGRSLRQSPLAIADYAETAGRRRLENDTGHGRQLGDPARAAEVILDLLAAEVWPPRRLLLGKDALERVSSALEEQMREIVTWSAISATTDFSNGPEDSHRALE